MWRRGRFAAEWRDEEPELHTMSPGEARAVNARVERKKKKMGQWANTADVQRLDDVAVRLGVQARMRAGGYSAGALRLHSMILGRQGSARPPPFWRLSGLTVAPAAAPFRIGTVFLTMKPEADITESLRKIAQATGRGFHVITQDGHGATTTYNPLKHGTAQMAPMSWWVLRRTRLTADFQSRTIRGWGSGPRWWRWRLWRRRWLRVWPIVQAACCTLGGWT